MELYDKKATKQNIIRLFHRLQKEIKTADSLLIYYPGHGYFDEITNSGYLIPTDSSENNFTQQNWISNSQIKGLISKIKATHILLITDSCFSGNILSMNRGLSLTIDNDYFRKAYTRNSRQVLTSGAREFVPDNSESALCLQQFLEKNQQPVIDPMMIYNEIRLCVSKTTPLLGNLIGIGHQEGGSFLLFSKNICNPWNRRIYLIPHYS